MFNNFSPRLGLTYDLTGNGKTIAQGQLRDVLRPGRHRRRRRAGEPGTRVERPLSVDRRERRQVRPGERDRTPPTAAGTSWRSTGNWDPNNPANRGRPRTRSIRTSRTTAPTSSSSASIARSASGSRPAPTTSGGGTATSRSTTRTGSRAVGLRRRCSSRRRRARARRPRTPVPDGDVLPADVPAADDHDAANSGGLTTATFNGVELTGRKRMSHHWLMNTSFVVQQHDREQRLRGRVREHDVAGGSDQPGDPQRIPVRLPERRQRPRQRLRERQVAVQAQRPVSAAVRRQRLGVLQRAAGLSVRAAIQSPSRANGAGIATILLDNVGENRLPTYQNLDFHVERPVKSARSRFIPSLDLFNVKQEHDSGAAAAAERREREQHQAVSRRACCASAFA